MKSHTKIHSQSGRGVFLRVALIAAVLTFAAGSTARADDRDKVNVLSPNAHSYGKTYDEWGAAWWQWALSIPADHNPLLDTTGADAAQGQSGPVWFLSGSFLGAAERTVTVPAGKALFFPIINNSWISTEPTDPQDVAGIRAIIDPPADAETDLSCQIDSFSVKRPKGYRTESPLFDVTMPDNNVFGIPAGTYGPSMDAGYYLLVAPLSPGHHEIHFHGALPYDVPPYWFAFTQDITYHLTVAEARRGGN
ncbi:MAG: hypothetical protein NTX27_08145 [Verrucomicrobia bacterium]|nr:hypothetical protein [Verrucomicrobiota bacterium]